MLDEIFLGINHSNLISGNEVADRAEHFLSKQNNQFIALGNNVDFVTTYLKEPYYYLLYSNYVVKGKTKIFKGNTIKTSIEDLLVFIKNVSCGVDREYYIIPITDPINYLFMVSEDGDILLFGTV